MHFTMTKQQFFSLIQQRTLKSIQCLWKLLPSLPESVIHSIKPELSVMNIQKKSLFPLNLLTKQLPVGEPFPTQVFNSFCPSLTSIMIPTTELIRHMIWNIDTAINNIKSRQCCILDNPKSLVCWQPKAMSFCSLTTQT